MVNCGWKDLKLDDLSSVKMPDIITEISRKLFTDLDAKVLAAVGSERLLDFYRTHHLVMDYETTNNSYIIKAHYEPNL